MNETRQSPNRKITIRMSEKTYEILVAVAKREGRSVNGVMNRMIDVYSKTYHHSHIKSIGDKYDGY